MIMDLHVHSNYSPDSLASPKRILRAAKRKGLDGVAITDHGTIAGALEAARANDDDEFIVIIGAELPSKAGDIVGLFLNDEIETEDPMEIIAQVHAQGGVVVLPHPLRGHELTGELLRSVDAIEVFNARCSPRENLQARALATEYGKPMVAGSDAHTCNEIGLARTELVANDPRQALLSAQTRLITDYAPYSAEALSQLIKSVRTRKYREVPIRAMSLLARMLGWRRRRMEA